MKYFKEIVVCIICLTILSSLAACGNKKAINSNSSSKSALYGEWLSSKGSLFVINKDGTSGWYKSPNNRKDNYYSGKKVVVLQGKDALKELGVDKNEQNRVSFYSDPTYIYSVKLYWNYLKSGGIDKSKKISKDGYEWLMFKITDSANFNKATAYDMKTDVEYDLTKRK